MPPTTHAKLSPSSSSRWRECPGSVALSEGIPDSPSFYSAEGTVAHDLLEWTLHDATNLLSSRLGESWERDGFEGTIDEEMIEAVRVAEDYVLDRVLALPNDEREVHLERRVNFERLGPPEGLDGGTADITIWSGPELRDLEVIDYKHGSGVYVEVEGNWQALQYALGAIATDGRRPNSIRTTIIQPRHHADPKIRHADYTWEEMVEFKADLFAAAEDTLADDAPLVVGDHCRFCPALPQCPEHHKHAVTLAQAEFDELAENPEVLTDPALLTPEQVAEVLRGSQYVENWIKALREHATNLLDSGVEVPGFKLVEGRRHRRWSDEDRAEAYLARKGFKLDERFKRTLVSPAQAEKLLQGEGHKTGYIQKYIEQPEGRPKLAPADDSRPALRPSVEQDFEALTEPLDDE